MAKTGRMSSPVMRSSSSSCLRLDGSAIATVSRPRTQNRASAENDSALERGMSRTTLGSTMPLRNRTDGMPNCCPKNNSSVSSSTKPISSNVSPSCELVLECCWSAASRFPSVSSPACTRCSPSGIAGGTIWPCFVRLRKTTRASGEGHRAASLFILQSSPSP